MVLLYLLRKSYILSIFSSVVAVLGHSEQVEPPVDSSVGLAVGSVSDNLSEFFLCRVLAFAILRWESERRG